MRIDPHAWIVTTPLTIGLIQVYSQPAHSALKRWWRQLNDAECMAWQQLGWRTLPILQGGTPRMRTIVFRLVVMSLAATSLASFAAFLGLTPA